MPQFQRKEVRDGIQHIRVRGSDAPRSFAWLKVLDLIYSIRAISVLPRADIVVTNTFWLPILLGQSAGKVYVHVARYPKGQMRFYARATRLQAPSTAVARAIEREAPRLKNKISVVPYPAPRAATAPPPISQRDHTMLYVGRVHPEKGIHLLVDAFTQATTATSTDWKLVIVGPSAENVGGGGEAYLTQLKQLAAGAAARIEFRGPIFNAADLEGQFFAARLFVYPSLAEYGESFGLAPLEAMAHGCAVMVSKLECFSDFIRDGDTGFVFDHRSLDPVAALRDRLAAAMGDQTRLANAAENAYRKSAEYSVDRVADQFLHDFSSLLT
jgi:glycosyltransferase involved in cell wall biosynthesis